MLSWRTTALSRQTADLGLRAPPHRPPHPRPQPAQAVEVLMREDSVKVDDSQVTHVLGSQQSPAASGGRPCSPLADSIVPV